MKKVIFSLIIIIYASMFLFVYAENIPGKNISLIKCQKNPSETYYCYLPSLYNGKEPLPVLYCFSPTGNGKSLVQVYQKVCEEVGWIIIGVNVSSRNSAPGGGISFIWKDTHQRFKIHSKRAYATGFSAGSWEASFMATKYPDNFSGLIKLAEGITESSTGQRGFGLKLTMAMPVNKLKNIAHYLLSGDRDGARDIFYQGRHFFKKAGIPIEIKLFPGGHSSPPQKLMEDAVRWMDTLYTKQIKNLSKIKTQLTKKTKSGSAEEKAHAKKLLKKLNRYVQNTKAEASALKSKDPTRAYELYQLLAKQFAGDKIGSDAKKMIDRIKKSASFQNMLKADKEWLKIEKMYIQLTPCKSHNPLLDTKNCKNCQNNNSKIGPKLFSGCRQLIQQYPDTSVARKCQEILTELGLK